VLVVVVEQTIQLFYSFAKPFAFNLTQNEKLNKKFNISTLSSMRKHIESTIFFSKLALKLAHATMICKE